MRIARFSRERWGIKSKERGEREREMMSLMEPSCAAMIWCWSFFDSASWVWKSVRPHRSAYERQKGRKYKMKKQMSVERLEHSRRSWQCRASTLLLLRCDNETLSLSCFTFRTLAWVDQRWRSRRWILDFRPRQTKPSSQFKCVLSFFTAVMSAGWKALQHSMIFNMSRVQGCSKAAFFFCYIRINVNGLLKEVSLPSLRSSFMLFVVFPFLQLK